MAIALVSGQSAKNYGTTQARTISFPGNVSNGSLIVVMSARYSGSPVTGIVGGSGNTFARIGTESQYAGDNALCCDLWYGYNINGGFTLLTVNAAAAQNSSLFVAEFSGAMIASTPLDQVAVGNTSTPSATPTSGNTPTLGQSDEMVFGATVPNIGDTSHTISAGAGYGGIQIDSDGNAHIAGGIESKIVAATTAVAATFGITGGNVGYICRAVTFKAAPPTPTSMALHMVLRRNHHLLVR